MSKLSLAQINIVLVEPAGPLNIGSIARVMKNMGLQQLVVVNPQCDVYSDDSKKMAVHAVDLLLRARIVQTLPEALDGCQRIVATTARKRRLSLNIHSPQQILPWLLADATAILFGPEDRGLSNEELYYAQACLQIPTSSDYPALNLAQAVTICCYELRQLVLHQANGADSPAPLPSRSNSSQDLAPFQQKEEFFQALETALLDIGYLYPHTAKARMQKLRLLFNRTQLSSQEVALLRGMIRQVHWRIHSK